MLYRILTEDINRKDIEDIVSTRFPGFSMISSIGYWKGTREYSLIIEILAEDTPTDRLAIADIAGNIKRANAQEAIMVQQFAPTSFLL